MWLTGDHVPRQPGFVSLGSRRYAEWQNPVLSATTETPPTVPPPEPWMLDPAVDRPEYRTPERILERTTTAAVSKFTVDPLVQGSTPRSAVDTNQNDYGAGSAVLDPMSVDDGGSGEDQARDPYPGYGPKADPAAVISFNPVKRHEG
ncbi:hypothetical protein PHMEG_0004924 [Phytophthora megakarya]|uniref:Eukaryotic/viral aspartic protease n=1 Tax=Phytophthora megakarya TaxID=4795 RepID=A0A225WSQ3_9STRA|nr:hypothetical protein PHMEG_0004916 [Phytophthora megakarya]OWZ20642.1 hypothetical protein PHMEG_0004924 [Phytophthora megakarya]